MPLLRRERSSIRAAPEAAAGHAVLLPVTRRWSSAKQPPGCAAQVPAGARVPGHPGRVPGGLRAQPAPAAQQRPCAAGQLPRRLPGLCRGSSRASLSSRTACSAAAPPCPAARRCVMHSLAPHGLWCTLSEPCLRRLPNLNHGACRSPGGVALAWVRCPGYASGVITYLKAHGAGVQLAVP